MRTLGRHPHTYPLLDLLDWLFSPYPHLFTLPADATLSHLAEGIARNCRDYRC
nr:hypothetical protein Q903MT_gene1851 [Picea sitchensis]